MAEALRQQDQTSESLRQNNLGGAADHQRQAAEALRQAADDLGAREKAGEQREDEDVPEDGGEPPEEDE